MSSTQSSGKEEDKVQGPKNQTEQWVVKTRESNEAAPSGRRDQTTASNSSKSFNQSGNTKSGKGKGFSPKYKTRADKNADHLSKAFANQEAKIKGFEDASKKLGSNGNGSIGGGQNNKNPPKTEPPKKTPAEKFAELPETPIKVSSATNFNIKTGETTIVEFQLAPFLVMLFCHLAYVFRYGLSPIYVFDLVVYKVDLHVGFTLLLLVLSFVYQMIHFIYAKGLMPNYIEIKYDSDYVDVQNDKDYRHDVVGVGDLKHKNPYFIWVVQTAYSRAVFNVKIWKKIIRSAEVKLPTLNPVNGKSNEQKFIISLELYMQLEASKFANLLDTKEDVFATIVRAASNFQSVNINRLTTLGSKDEKLVVNNTALVAFYAYLEHLESRNLDFLLPLSRRTNFCTVIDTVKLNCQILEMSRRMQLLHELALWILPAGYLFRLLPLVP